MQFCVADQCQFGLVTVLGNGMGVHIWHWYHILAQAGLIPSGHVYTGT
jgi:hypothetical protein